GGRGRGRGLGGAPRAPARAARRRRRTPRRRGERRRGTCGRDGAARLTRRGDIGGCAGECRRLQAAGRRRRRTAARWRRPQDVAGGVVGGPWRGRREPCDAVAPKGGTAREVER